MTSVKVKRDAEIRGHTSLFDASKRALTFPRLALDIDGLCGVVAVIILDRDKVRVGLSAEVGPERKHVVVAVIQSFQNLKSSIFC